MLITVINLKNNLKSSVKFFTPPSLTLEFFQLVLSQSLKNVHKPTNTRVG